MKCIIKLAIIVFLFLNNSFSILLSATIYSPSCSQLDVQSSINAASDGDTVAVPSGASTWASSVTFKNKALVLRGAGLNSTIITDNTGTAWNQCAFFVEGKENKPFRITGFTIKSSNAPASIIILGDCKNWRIDHIKFENNSSWAIGIGSCNGIETFGVIDHCQFMKASGNTAGIYIYGDPLAWERPAEFGSSNAVYIEDCVFDYGPGYISGSPALDAYQGAKYVFRHNKLTNQSMGHHDACTGCPGNPRATFSFEIYNNSFEFSASVNPFIALGLRGGTGVVYNNDFHGNIIHPLSATNYRSCLGDGTVCDAIYDRCDGNSNFDGNEDPTGYPSLDQIGRTTNQKLLPLYEWNNICNKLDVDVFIHNPAGCDNPSVYDHIKENRDYYNDTPKSDYTSYTYPHPFTLSNTPKNLRFVKGE